MREPYPNELYHYGVKGMKWGVIRDLSDYINKRRKARAQRKLDNQMNDIRKRDAESSSRSAEDSSVHLRAQGERSAKDAALLGASRAVQSPKSLEQYYDWIGTKISKCVTIMAAESNLNRALNSYINENRPLRDFKGTIEQSLSELGFGDLAKTVRAERYDNNIAYYVRRALSQTKRLVSLAYEDYRGYEAGLEKVKSAAVHFTGKFDKKKQLAAEAAYKSGQKFKNKIRGKGYYFNLDDSGYNNGIRRRRSRAR